MDKVHAVKHLAQLGYSERRISDQLGISRTAVRNHSGRTRAKDTKAPTGSAPIGSDLPKDTMAPTGSGSSSDIALNPVSSSECEPYKEVILEMLARGLTAQRIYQDLQNQHGFSAKYYSTRRYVARLCTREWGQLILVRSKSQKTFSKVLRWDGLHSTTKTV